MRSFLLSLVLVLVLAAPAMGQGSGQDGYTPEGPQVVEQTRDSGSGTEGRSLPFTGMDLMLIGGLGIGLLGAGVGMRRLTRPHPA